MKRLLRYLRYSGAAVTITVNPLSWKVVPWFQRQHDIWDTPGERTWAGGFLFLTLRLWIDDGRW